MPDWNANYAYDEFVKRRADIDAAKGSNEAKTRLAAINTMLLDVLGWDLKHIDAEKHVRAEGFADYVLRNDDVSVGVIEAKKDGDSFCLQGIKYPDGPVGFGLLAKESKHARDAMIQAAGYASSLGAKYIAITNGHQYVITLAFVSGVPIENRSVIVFESLDAIEKRFRLFFDCFSPEGVRGNKLATKLLESRRAPAPTKLSASISDYPRPANRNVLVNEIGWVLSTVWDKANENDADDDFLKHCYVTPEATKGTLAQAKEIIQQRSNLDNSLVSSEVIPQSGVLEVVASPHPEKPIIVLGRVGHGKSTFLSYLRLIEAKPQLSGYIQIEVNFIDRPTSSHEVQRYVFNAFDRQMLDRYSIDVHEAAFARASLDSELRRFRRTVKGSRHPEGSADQQRVEDDFVDEYQKDTYKYLVAVVRHLRRSHRKSLAIFFDNLDRRDDAFQEQAFLEASAIARDWEALIFVCLRPGTFYRSAATGGLDVIAPRTITIDPPRPEIVLKKRFEYAREVASGDSSRTSGLPTTSFGKVISAELPTAATFFECCRNSFAHNRDLTSVFAAAANGDMRSLLRYVRDFLTSLHLDTGKIIEKLGTGGYRLASHEAVRALLFRDYWHYDPGKSVFPNVFDIEHADGMEHFIRPLALHFLERQPDTSLNHGFIPTQKVEKYLCQLGFSQDTAETAITWLLKKKCLEDKFGENIFVSAEDQVRITSLGKFIVGDLMTKFTYYDAVVVDTPITDPNVRLGIRDDLAIDARVTRTKSFKAYLDKCAESVVDMDASAFWKSISGSLDADITRVSASMGARRI